MNKEKSEKLINSIFKNTYFVFKELCCKCGCNAFSGDIIFLKKLLLFRILCDFPIIPRSVYRCQNHPDYSDNHNGHAIDVPCEENNSNRRFKIIKAAIYAGFKRIGISKTYIHLDDNPKYNGTLNEEVLWIYS